MYKRQGIGSALILDGRPYPGSHFQSGEIGYSDYSSSEEYLEIDYSTLGILRRASALTGSQLDGFAFIQRIRDNDPCCLQLLEDWTAKLGRVLANNILMLDPDRVVIGGGISKQSTTVSGSFIKGNEIRIGSDAWTETGYGLFWRWNADDVKSRTAGYVTDRAGAAV